MKRCFRREKRLEIARAQNVPPYVIFHDRTLIELATARPASHAQMADVPGVGDTKLERYGPAFWPSSTHTISPAEIIAPAVWLYYRFPLSLRDVEDFLAERGIIVTFQTVAEWAAKFGLKFAHQLRCRSRGHFADKWQLDDGGPRQRNPPVTSGLLCRDWRTMPRVS